MKPTKVLVEVVCKAQKQARLVSDGDPLAAAHLRIAAAMLLPPAPIATAAAHGRLIQRERRSCRHLMLHRTTLMTLASHAPAHVRAQLDQEFECV